jgi:hypothetical protein
VKKQTKVELSFLDAAIVYNLLLTEWKHKDHKRIADEIYKQMYDSGMTK